MSGVEDDARLVAIHIIIHWQGAKLATSLSNAQVATGCMLCCHARYPFFLRAGNCKMHQRKKQGGDSLRKRPFNPLEGSHACDDTG
jgi:hypothetical protein